jgi:hypothetical protein
VPPLGELCCKNDSIAVAQKNRVAMLNAAVTNACRHTDVAPDSGGRCQFQGHRAVCFNPAQGKLQGPIWY